MPDEALHYFVSMLERKQIGHLSFWFVSPAGILTGLAVSQWVFFKEFQENVKTGNEPGAFQAGAEHALSEAGWAKRFEVQDAIQFLHMIDVHLVSAAGPAVAKFRLGFLRVGVEEVKIWGFGSWPATVG